MGTMDVVWILVLLALLQPALRQWWLESRRRGRLRKIERARDSRVILLVHRQERLSFLGIPLFRFIDVNDSEEVLRAIRTSDPEQPLDLLLHTPGGMVLASLQIARALRRHRGTVTIVVPHYAMSGGTLIALAADRILLAEHAVLGPVDPQIGKHPAVSLLRAVDRKPIERVDDETLILADQAEKARNQLRRAVAELASDDLSAEQKEDLARALADGHWTHDYPIGFDEARQLGLPVDPDVPRSFFDLLQLYPQPMRRRGGVEYLPRRKSDDGDDDGE